MLPGLFVRTGMRTVLRGGRGLGPPGAAARRGPALRRGPGPAPGARGLRGGAAAAAVGEGSSSGYGAESIQVLEGLEPVRKRPGMYIGTTGQRGLHHLVYEIVDNAVDEVQAGFAKNVHVELDRAGGWVRVRDDGRGIPTDVHPVTQVSTLETVLTVLHAGGKFGGDASGYTVSGGVHGVGVSVVNALSADLEARVWRDGQLYSQRFQQGRRVSDLECEPQGSGGPAKGTEIRFRPDLSIFKSGAAMDPKVLNSRLRELAFLNSGVRINFAATNAAKAKKGAAAAADEGDGDAEVHEHHYEGGLKEYVAWMTDNNATLHAPFHILGREEGVQVEVALQWCSDMFTDNLAGYANSIRTVDGGTHLDGFKASVTRTVNSLCRKNGTLKEADKNFTGDHVREGLNAVVSVKVQNPEFEGQTKTRLGSPSVRKVVDKVVSEALNEILDMHPEALNAIAAKAMQAQKASEAAKRARDLVRRKSVLSRTSLPGKLSDCASLDPAESEIFLVEGDSAGGTAKQARDRGFQAVLPLRGKILNVEKADEESMYKSNEISNLITGLGLGVRGEALNGLRYHKVILLTDADVDGAHIRTLLLTFLFRYQRELFTAGHVYVGVPPLYKVVKSRSRKEHYLYSDAEMAEFTRDLKPGSYAQQRFKGLGEMMPQQLWDTTLNPETRRLRKLTVEDAAEASHIFTLLMGDKVGPRRSFIVEESRRLGLGDLDV